MKKKWEEPLRIFAYLNYTIEYQHVEGHRPIIGVFFDKKCIGSADTLSAAKTAVYQHEMKAAKKESK